MATRSAIAVTPFPRRPAVSHKSTVIQPPIDPDTFLGEENRTAGGQLNENYRHNCDRCSENQRANADHNVEETFLPGNAVETPIDIEETFTSGRSRTIP